MREPQPWSLEHVTGREKDSNMIWNHSNSFIHLSHLFASLSFICSVYLTLNICIDIWVCKRNRELCYWLQFATTGQRVNMCKRNLIARCEGVLQGEVVKEVPKGLQGALRWYNTLAHNLAMAVKSSAWFLVILSAVEVLDSWRERSFCQWISIHLITWINHFEPIQRLWCVSLQIWK